MSHQHGSLKNLFFAPCASALSAFPSYFPAPFSGSNPAGAFSAWKARSPQEQIQGVSRELGKWTVMGPPGAAPHQITHTLLSCLIGRREKSPADTANVCKQKVRTNLASFDRVGLQIRGLWSLTYKVVLQPCENLTGLQLPQAGIWAAPDVVLLSLKTVWELGRGFKEGRWILHWKAAVKGLPSLHEGSSYSSLFFLLPHCHTGDCHEKHISRTFRCALTHLLMIL